MTVRQMRKLLANLPPNMKIGWADGSDIIHDICVEDSGVEIMEDAKTGEFEDVLLLFPCLCNLPIINMNYKVHEDELKLN